MYQSFFDLHGGYFDYPRLMAEVKRLNQMFNDATDHDCSSVAEILAATDEASCSYAAFESGFMQQTLQPAQVQLAKLGAPHDSILVNDLELADLKHYKLIMLLNCFRLTEAQRECIRRKVLKGNRTAVWCYAPGFFNGSRASIEAVRELTGLHIQHAQTTGRVRLCMVLNEAGLAFMGHGGHNAATTASLPGLGLTEVRAPEDTVVGHEHVRAQLFFVADPQATALGHVEGRMEVGLALKRMPHRTSVYTLNPVLPSASLRALAGSAGVHIYCDLDDTLYASRCFLTLAADKGGDAPWSCHVAATSSIRSAGRGCGGA